MENEILTNVSEQEGIEDVDPAVKALMEMEKTHVRREEYDKIKNKYQQVVDAYVNGQKIEAEIVEKPVDFMELVDTVRCKDRRVPAAEWMEAVLKLREEAIRRGFRDPGVGIENEFNPITDDKIRASEECVQGLSEMLEASEGDSYLFIKEYQRNVEDPILPKNSKRKF